MNKIHHAISLLFAFIGLTVALSACHPIEEYKNDNKGNFDALWKIVDERYCFFAEKDIDWNEVYSRYSPRISQTMTQQELFGVCGEMLAELKDGHTNLISPFEVSYYRKWWSDYPQNFDLRLIQQYYFNFNYKQTSGMTYGMLKENIGYIYYPTFSAEIGAGNLDWVLADLKTANGLIIDVRNNGGGNLTNVETLVSRFLREKMMVGSISHKKGPGHNDFSTPYSYYFTPAGKDHVMWGKPVVVIANRATFSAANNFVAIMKHVPGVTIVGATTGGGSGMPFNSELPNGWGVRFSACSVLDPVGKPTEQGVIPTEGCEIDMDPAQAANGHDTILDFAINYLTSKN